MKKILLLIVLLVTLSGCSDYKEVNEMAIVSAIGIDYQDDEFIVTLETFNNKVEKDSGKVNTYTRTGKGKSVAIALEEAADKLSQRAYYSHVKLCVISENVALNYLDKVADFIIRSTYLRENFRVVVSKKAPVDILNIETDENPVSSIAINLLLQTNAYASNYATDKAFDIFLSDVIEFGKDGAMSIINVDEGNFYIDGLAIFDEYKMVDELTNDDAVIYNLLKGEIKKPVFNLEYNEESVAISIYDIKTDISVDKNYITLEGTYKAKIIENSPNFDIKDTTILEKLDKDFTKLINDKITKFIKKLQENKSDVIYLADKYYIKNREKDEKIWLKANIKSNIQVVINKKGLIFNIYENN